MSISFLKSGWEVGGEVGLDVRLALGQLTCTLNSCHIFTKRNMAHFPAWAPPIDVKYKSLLLIFVSATTSEPPDSYLSNLKYFPFF